MSEIQPILGERLDDLLALAQQTEAYGVRLVSLTHDELLAVCAEALHRWRDIAARRIPA